jgi:HEPN domain-containing protein
MKANNKSTWFLQVATHDYVAARCCLLNGLLSGFVLAHEAIEKLLKACIYLADPNFRPGASEEHRLEVLADHVHRLHPAVEFSEDELLYLKKLTTYFETKYPDAKVPRPSSVSTAELVQIDQLFVRLSFEIPLVPELKWRIGIFNLVGADQAQERTLTRWLRTDNAALSPDMVASIVSNFQTVSGLPRAEVEIVMPIPIA